MRVEIICTGDEVLTGKIVNTNFSYMSQKLEDVGLSVHVCGIREVEAVATRGERERDIVNGRHVAIGHPQAFDLEQRRLSHRRKPAGDAGRRRAS